MRILRLLPLAVLAGCRGGGQMLPLEEGKSWTYSVYNNYETNIEPIEVEGRVPVGTVEGYVLGGPMGTSAVAWEGKTLVASRLANSAFSPPVPIGLADMPGKEPAMRQWKGTVEAFGRRRKAFGVLVQSTDRILYAGQRVKCAKADLTLRLADGKTRINLTTWYRPGDGILKQEQRTNDRHVVTLTRLDAE